MPLAIVGSNELYIGRRMATRVLPADDRAGAARAEWHEVLPEEGSRAELDLAHRLTERLAELLGPAVTELYPSIVDPPDRPRRLRGLTWLLLSRRRPLSGLSSPGCSTPNRSSTSSATRRSSG